MGYRITKAYIKKNGDRVWRVQFEYWENGKRKFRAVRKSEWSGIGFSDRMSEAEAKEHAKILNNDAQSNKLEEKRQKILERVAKEGDLDTLYLPRTFVDSFEADLTRRFGQRDFYNRIISNWRATKLLIQDIKLQPEDFQKNSELIYQYFERKAFSHNYVKRIIRMLNLWGNFLGDKRKRYYPKVEIPKGLSKERIADKFFDSGKSKVSDEITPDDLPKLKHLPKELYNWVFISVWFGLRPEEIDSLHKPQCWKLDTQDGIPVLWNYQSKLTSIPRDKRWKLIPIIEPEQEIALEMIKSGEFRRPLVKTLKTHLKKNCTCYGGRKGFVDLMLSRGHEYEDIKYWMGHRRDITDRTYKSWLKVKLTKKK